jgi:tetrahedral aminopeptidase
LSVYCAVKDRLEGYSPLSGGYGGDAPVEERGNDMDILSFLRESTSKFGPVGHERAMAEWLKEQFAPFCDTVEIDPLFNVIAVKKPTVPPKGNSKEGKAAPPVIMLCAHMDEIALLVTEILDDGSLRIFKNGGVDPKILPASTVTVHTDDGDLFGVIGAKPPHLLTAEDRKHAVKFEDLYVDLGMKPDAVKAKVNVGDMVTLHGGMAELLNGRAASKTIDDRSCIAVMLNAAERLQKMSHAAEVVFCCSAQEEVGGNGAHVGAYTVAPDIAFVLDVTFSNYPGAKPDTTLPPDRPALSCGPFVQHKLLDKLKDIAKKNGVKYSIELCPRGTGTDADDIQIARGGVPCVLAGLPVSYMHTTVELLDVNTVSECGRLAAAFAAEIEEGWDTDLWT